MAHGQLSATGLCLLTLDFAQTFHRISHKYLQVIVIWSCTKIHKCVGVVKQGRISTADQWLPVEKISLYGDRSDKDAR
jgi:hypothetical protein